MPSTTIIIKDLLKTFPAVGSAPPATAVDRVSLTIEPGELFFLLGPSGCGKTTLLRMIAGFIEPTSGAILFDDGSGKHTDVTFMPAEKRGCGMVFQSYALWPHMTVAQNVAFGLEVRKVPKAERETLVQSALAQVRMEQYAQRKPNQLSGGQQQRVALARAIVIKPRVLLLDEPLSNLDAKLRTELRSEIRRVCKAAGTTTVYVTHDQKEALSMADRIAIMRAGKIVQVGPPRDLYALPRSRFAAEFMGETNILPATVESVNGSSIRVRTAAGVLESHSPTTTLKPGAEVLVSIRPEAFEHASNPASPNTLAAKLLDSTYLGEVAQDRFSLQGGLEVIASTLNPKIQASPSAVFVKPDSVILLDAAS